MRVNLISNHRPGTEVWQDISIMRGILTAVFDEKIQIQNVQYVQPHCDEADINIFIESINPSLFPYAGKNIWITNPEMTSKKGEPYFHIVNEIWVKTHEAEEIFKKLTPTTVRYIGWSSLNKETPSKKNYFKAIVPLCSSSNREYEPLFKAYQILRVTDSSTFYKLPKLNIVYNPQRFDIKVPDDISDYVVLHSNLKDSEYDELLKECGVCICLSKGEGFGHAVNESLASGCNVIVSSIQPFLKDIVGESNLGAWFCDVRERVDNETTYGNSYFSDIQSIVDVLDEYANTSFKKRKEGSEFMRSVYEANHSVWMKNIQAILPHVLHVETPYSLKESMPKEEDLPDVSIVCVTRDRRVFMHIVI